METKNFNYVFYSTNILMKFVFKIDYDESQFW